MPQVPYSPVPDVVPDAPGVRPADINTPPAAFGVTVAQSIEGLGKQAEQSADELSRTALAIKGLQNETWAKGAFVDASAKVGEKDAQFYSLKGQDAVNARPQYEQDIRQIYTDAMQNAPNNQARSMLGDSLARRISYSIDDGQKHAGQQQLEAMNTVSNSRVADAISAVQLHPNNDGLFNQGLATIRAEAQAQAEHAGVPETAAVNARMWTGMAWENRIKTIAFNNPMAAQEMYTQHKDEIEATGTNKSGVPYSTMIQENIQQRMDAVGTRQVADQIIAQTLMPDDVKPSDIKVDAQGNEIPRSADENWKSAGPDFLQRALEAADKWAHDNGSTAQFQSLLETRIREAYNVHHDAVKQAEYGLFLGVYGAAIGAGGGQRITSMDTILNNPVLAEQYNQLSPPRQQQIQNVVRNSAVQGTMDPMEADTLYHKILGMGLEAENNQTARDNFSQIDPSEFAGKLPKAMIDGIYAEQKKVGEVWAKRAEANDHLNQAMSFLRPTLESAGMKPSATDSHANDMYMTFEGAFYEKLTKIEQQEGKPITDEARIMKIAAPLLQSVGAGQGLFGRWMNPGQPTFQPPQAAITTMTTNFRAKYGYDPNPFQLGQMYMKALALPAGSQQRKELGLD